jgi:glycosyltransferase involved in cell wall biosynthesis
MQSRHIAFVSTMGGYAWGGSEELWSRSALELSARGFRISASVVEWLPLHGRVQDLRNAGVDVQLRPQYYALRERAWHRLTFWGKTKAVLEVGRLLRRSAPALVVFSDGGARPPIELLELSVTKNLPFVTIAQANSDNYWLDDVNAERYRNALECARRCYFVSEANLQLAERQLGCKLANAEVVWNPFNVDFYASPSWPKLSETDELRLACVARLHPPSKGQDVLLEALARPPWASRNWRLTLYGEGPMRNMLERLAERLGVSSRVVFGGHIAVEDIWAANHVLVMPSRFEGLPLAMVEAMLCARPVLGTDVGGNSEIIEDGVTGFLAEAPTVPIVARSLERLWEQRANLEQMGKAGAKRIRELVPSDPVRVFSEKLMHLIGMP